MDKILQQLYQGTIHPQEDYRPILESYGQVRRKTSEKKQVLLDKIARENSELCIQVEELLDEINAVSAMEMEDTYIQGMRMGARLVMALLKDK